MKKTLTFALVLFSWVAMADERALQYGSGGKAKDVVSAEVYDLEAKLHAPRTNLLWLIHRLELAEELRITDAQADALNAISLSNSHSAAFLEVVPHHPQFPGTALDLTTLPKSRLKELGKTLTARYSKIDQETDERVREILSTKQNKRLNEVLFQYYWIECSPRKPHKALALYGIDVGDLDLRAINRQVTSRETVEADRELLLKAKFTALRDLVGRGRFDRLFGRSFEPNADQLPAEITRNPRRGR